MKIRSILGLALLAYTSLVADFHEPVIGVTYDHFSDSKFSANINHQTSLLLSDQDVLALYVYSNVDKSAKFHHELGIGYRKHFENFGIGMNIVSNHFNKLVKFNHQFVPGLEIFVGNFQISLNRYIPLRSIVKKKYNPNLVMYDVSEISVLYRFADVYEVGITPYINHQTKYVGVTGHFAKYFANNWKISVNPYYHQAEKGASVSFGFDFGGPKTNVNAPIQKSHRFFYTIVAHPSDNITSSTPKKEEPVVLLPAKYGSSVEQVNAEIKKAEKDQSSQVKDIEIVKKKAGGEVFIRLK